MPMRQAGFICGARAGPLRATCLWMTSAGRPALCPLGPRCEGHAWHSRSRLSPSPPAMSVRGWPACPPASRMRGAVCVSPGPCRAVCGCRKAGVPDRALWGAELGWAAGGAQRGVWEAWRRPPPWLLGATPSLRLPAGCVHHDCRLLALLLPLLLLLGAHGGLAVLPGCHRTDAYPPGSQALPVPGLG